MKTGANELDLNKIDSRSLACSVSEDDRNAFNLFYEVYYADVFRFAYYFLQRKEACCEVVPDVFFAVWKSRKKLKEITNMKAYLYVVTRHEAMRYIEKQPEEQFLPLEKIPVRLQADVAASPEDQLIDKEIEGLLTDVINELPEKCRKIFLMARENGLKYKEIGDILSISEQTVRVQMKIAIEKIISKIRLRFPHLTLTALFIYLFHSF